MSDNDALGQVRAVMSNAEEVDLPEGVAPDSGDDGCPDDYSPPPPPPENGPDQGGEPEDPVSASSRQPLNDIGNGQRFRIHFGENILFVSQVGWFVWDGARWKRDPEISRDCSPLIRGRAHQMSGLIEKEIDFLQPSKRDRQLLNEERDLRKRRIEIEATPDYAGDETLITELGQIGARLRTIDGALKSHKSLIGRRLTHAKNAGNSGPMSNMINEARVMLAHAVDEMDRGDLDVNTLSGVLRFKRIAGDPQEGMTPMSEVELIPPDRGQLLTKVVPVEYEPDATCPRFDAFLQQIQPNIEMRRFLQRWFGLSMSGIDIQKLAFFHGGGANGKSVLVDLMARMMGDYAATAKIESLTGKNKKSGSDSQPDLIPLIGARMVRTSEPEEGERLQEGLVKALTGGEPMMVRALYTDMITFQPIFKLTISGNHLPDIRGGDDGIWRRLMLVTFPVQIPENKRIPKKELDEILWQERSGILNWLVQGLLDYLDGGLQEPEDVTMATEGYRKDSDPIGTFLADATTVTGYEGDFMTARELIEAFNFWIEERGETRWGNRTVSNRLKAKAGTWRHPDTQKPFAAGKSGVTGYRGIRLSDAFSARMREAEARASQNSSWSSPR
ncbi:DNA primase [Paracoccus phage vB_PthS_Pthi1]|uniref:Putative DNA primase/helicase n=1 Tax=Paracoccus thiocyanatus TaxID=34006 RepID=A0A1N6SG33_9RHOB|nr:DNA primase family protein [Paracoccus thiocyanatus]AZV00385.1 DNA primase [Paracoccus phage vB_PthS_Pthi1]SIQ40113.1 putative DNA primase/helicase [Paracoccus thiocyanatus]